MAISVVVLFMLGSLKVSTAFQWITTNSPQNGTAIQACSGQDVKLPLTFILESPYDSLRWITWYYKPTGGERERAIARQTPCGFGPIRGNGLHLDFLSDGGLRLHNVAIANTGTYSAQVNLHSRGFSVRKVKTVDVLVRDVPQTTDGMLHAELLPGAVYDNSTKDFHLQLSCGDFTPVWEDSVDIVWKTPSKETIKSTSQQHGRFLLSVPNPVAAGEYTCAIADASPASICIESGSALKRGATVTVNGTEAMFILMEARMSALKKEHSRQMSALKQKLSTRQ